jgi:hypothetical protein
MVRRPISEGTLLPFRRSISSAPIAAIAGSEQPSARYRNQFRGIIIYHDPRSVRFRIVVHFASMD